MILPGSSIENSDAVIEREKSLLIIAKEGLSELSRVRYIE